MRKQVNSPHEPILSYRLSLAQRERALEENKLLFRFGDEGGWERRERKGGRERGREGWGWL